MDGSMFRGIGEAIVGAIILAFFTGGIVFGVGFFVVRWLLSHLSIHWS